MPKGFCERLEVVLLVFELHGLADFAKVDDAVLRSEGSAADVASIV